MNDYKKMYCVLCGAVSQALDCLPETENNREGRELLQNALYEAEEIYMEEAAEQ